MSPIFNAVGSMCGKSSSDAAAYHIGTKISDSVVLLHEPETSPKIEVVFIHGLHIGDHCNAYWRTWLARDGTQDNCWPTTWLINVLPPARILALSYDASTFRSTTDGRTDMYALGERLLQEMVFHGKIGQNGCPLVFVCHCVGGLVAKQIIVTAQHRFRGNDQVRHFLRNINGLYFYGTPHRGSKLADLASYIYRTGPLVKFLEVLNDSIGRLNSEFEQIQHEEFNNQWRFSVVAETASTTYLDFGGRVVEETSARYGYSRFLLVDANHFDICRPTSETSSSFLDLKLFLHDLKESHLEGISVKIPEKIVGMDEKEKVLNKKLHKEQVVGLVGMGGIGKTTLSRWWYRSKLGEYEKSSFLEDVKSKRIDVVQKQLLLDLCDLKLEGDTQVNEGHLEKIRQCITKKKVLVVVDDVGTEDKLVELQVPVFQNVQSASKAIVTCRNWQELEYYVKPEGKMVIDVLDDKQSMELFSYYAFGGTEGPKTLMHLSIKIVKACCGLPLSLEVLGQFLRKKKPLAMGNQLQIWRDTLLKLRNAHSFGGGTDNEKLWSRLRISYDDLDWPEKQLFLDFACMFCEFKDRRDSQQLKLSTIRRIGDSWCTLQNLIDRSLVQIDMSGHYLLIHDQLRDMGRRIVKDQAPVSRLWTMIDAQENLLNDEVSPGLEGISLQECSISILPKEEKPCQSKNKQSNRYPRLRLLNLHKAVRKVVEYCITMRLMELQWLCLSQTEITEVPDALTKCKNLRVLHLRQCMHLIKLPDSIGDLVNLLELDLGGCELLMKLPLSISKLIRLEVLQLYWCVKLFLLPEGVGQLAQIKLLNLNQCESLQSLCEFKYTAEDIYDPEGINNLGILPVTPINNLQELDLSCCKALKCLPNSIGELIELEELRLFGCTSLEVLPESLGQLTCLRILDLDGCEELERLPESISQLEKLEELYLSYCRKLKNLPCLSQLVNLRDFRLAQCRLLAPMILERIIPMDFRHLQHLELPTIPHHLPATQSLRTLYLLNWGQTDSIHESLFLDLTRLEELNVSSNLRELPYSLGALTSLKRLRITKAEELVRLPESLGKLSHLQKLELFNCKELKEFPSSLLNLSQLQVLSVRNCNSLEGLPQELGRLSQLLELTLTDGLQLKALPRSLGRCSHLSSLELRDCGLEGLPEGLGELSQLQKLELSFCSKLGTLPESLGQLSRLKELILYECRGLTHLPQELGGLSHLHKLDLRYCSKLETLPESVGRLSLLKVLRLEECQDLIRLPRSLARLSQLSTLDLSGCKNLQLIESSILQELAGHGCSIRQ